MEIRHPELRLRTLGELRLQNAAGEQLAGRRRELVLLAYLLRRAPQPTPRAELATVFWGNRPEVRARHSLRQALSQLRRLVGDALAVDADTVAVEPSVVAWDLLEVEALLAAGEHAQAVDACGGELLPEAEDRACAGLGGWIAAEREGLRRRIADALDALVTRAEACGDWTNAARWAERWTRLAPLDEEPHRRCIEALLLAGRRSDALACHGRFAALHAEERGSEPSAGFVRLGERILADRGAADASGGASERRQSWLRFEGRQAEFGALVDAWNEASAGRGSLVIVRGEEGVGKSRLCQEFLSWLAQRDRDGFVLHARLQDTAPTAEWSAARELLAGLPAAPGLAGVPTAALATLAALVPRVREVYPQLPETDGEPVSEPRVRAAVERVIDDIAFETPVAVVVDAVPRADVASRRLIRALSAYCAGRRVMIVVTGRTAELAAMAELDELGAEVGPRTLSLGPLSLPHVESLLMDVEPRPEARRAVAARLHAETAGYPRYLLQVLETELQRPSRGDRDPDGGAPGPPSVPEEVAAAVRRRLDRLSREAKAVLASVVQVPGCWRPAQQPPPAGIPRESVPGALEQLVAAGFLEPAAAGGFAFRVPIVRRAVMASLPAPAAHPARRGRSAWRRRHGAERGGRPLVPWAAALVAMLVVFVAGLQHLLRAERPVETAVSTAKIAVFPFAVSGEPYEYLGDGMVDLLSVNLSGAGDLRTVNRHSLLSFLRDEPAARLDVERAAQIARRFGAGTFVVGSVLGSGARLRIVAELHDPARGPEPVSRASVEGASDELLELVDRLSARLLAQWNEEAGARIAGLAARTTGSLPALKAYLRGEHHLRQGHYLSAAAAFEAAVAEDSSFALAHFRLSVAAEWTMHYDAARAAMQRAVRHGARLPDRERLLLRSTLALNRGAAAEAENLARSILAVDADDAEAWFQLGEVLFHYGPRSGRPIDEARVAFERTVALEPHHLKALVHLARIAASHGRAAEVDSLAGRVIELSADADPAWEMRALQAAVNGEAAPTLLATMRGADPERVVMAAWSTAVFGGDLGLARALAESLTRPEYAPPWWSIGWVLIAQLETARGRPAAAADALDRLRRVDRAAGVKYAALLGALPHLPTSADRLDRLRGELRAWADTELAPPRPEHGLFAIHAGLQPHLRAFLEGLVEIRASRLDRIDRHADALLAMPVRSSEDHALVNDLTRTLRGEATLRRGDADEAVRILEHDTEVWHQRAIVSPFYSRAYQRFVRAGALASVGRDDEALVDYSSFAMQAIHDLVYLAPAHLRSAEIHERRGDAAQARVHRARFVALWRDAEPALQPIVRAARHRLEAP